MQYNRITTKADAMAFAIELSTVNLSTADRIYRMFVDNMELPDTETAAADNCFKSLAEATEALTRKIETRLAENAEKFETSESTSLSTIILPGMSGLEWMTENLSGFGGTEIDGRTYYTYDEAEEAVKQLGDGWRIPTRGEMVDLADLGSEWQEDGPHGLPGRLFGGGLFLEAAGYRASDKGALTEVGTRGLYYSSSSFAAGNYGAGYLNFASGYVSPLNNACRAAALSVRCVRNVK